jgi:predicted nucleic acid-binding protein
VARIILLDSGPLGLAASQPGTPLVVRFDAWITSLVVAGALVVVSEIADYEVRRELLRRRATAGLKRLDDFEARFPYLPLSTPAMRRATEFWAEVRRLGLPTAAPDALDADCIIAAQAAVSGGPGDAVTIATNNIVHLARFPAIDAREWSAIT